MLTRVRDLWHYLAPWRRRYGVLAGSRLGLQVRRLAYAAPAGTIVSLRVPGLRHAAYGRARTSDAFVFRQHFLEHELGPGLPATADAIIDAGANVGYAALYLAWRYPEARILCVEVDAGNLAMLGRNVAAYPNIAVVAGGLWSHATRLAITNPEGSAFAFVVVEQPDGPIAAFGVDDLQRSQRLPRIDLLKLDIEGAEIEVLSSAGRWIGDVGTILVEQHEGLRPGCEAMVASMAATHGFATSPSGEYTVLRRMTSSITPPTGSP